MPAARTDYRKGSPMTAFLERKTVADELANRILQSGIAHAAEIDVPAVIAVVDDAGILKAFVRMDGAPLLSVQVAQDKAYTAAASGRSTDEWYDFIKDEPALALGAPAGIERLIVFGGGIPLLAGGAIVGAVGVSGAHYARDMEIAAAAVRVMDDHTD